MSTIQLPAIKSGYVSTDYSSIKQQKPELVVVYDGGKGQGTPIGEDDVYTNVNKAKVLNIHHGINDEESVATLSFPDKEFGDQVNLATPIKILANSGLDIVFKGILVKETARLKDNTLTVEAYGPRFILNKDTVIGKFYSNNGIKYPNPLLLKVTPSTGVNHARKKFWITPTGCPEASGVTSSNCGYILVEQTIFNPIDENNNPVKNCYRKKKAGGSPNEYNVAFAIPHYASITSASPSLTTWTYGDVLRYINQYYIKPSFSDILIDDKTYLILDRMGSPKDLNLDCHKIAQAISTLMESLGVNIAYKFEIENNKHILKLIIPKGLVDINGNDFDDDLIQRQKKLVIGSMGEIRDAQKSDDNYSKAKAAEETDINVNDITATRDIINTATQYVGVSDPIYIELTFKLEKMWSATQQTTVIDNLAKFKAIQSKKDPTKPNFDISISSDIFDTIDVGRKYKLPTDLNTIKAAIDPTHTFSELSNEVDGYIIEGLTLVKDALYTKSRDRKIKSPKTPEVEVDPRTSEPIKYSKAFLIKHDLKINDGAGTDNNEFSIIGLKGGKRDGNSFDYDTDTEIITFDNPMFSKEYLGGIDNQDIKDIDGIKNAKEGEIFCDVYATVLVPLDIPSFVSKYETLSKDAVIPFNILKIERKNGYQFVFKYRSILKYDPTNTNLLTKRPVSRATRTIDGSTYHYLTTLISSGNQRFFYMQNSAGLYESTIAEFKEYINQKYQKTNKIAINIDAKLGKLNTSYKLGDAITEILWSGSGGKVGYKELKTSITGIVYNGASDGFTTDLHITDLFPGV